MLVIFLLLFASMTMGFPTDGAEDVYQDESFYGDLTTFATGAWDTFFDLPSVADQFAAQDNLDGAVASPGTARRMYHYPSPNPTMNQPYIYPPGAMDLSMLENNNEVQALNIAQRDENTLGRMPDLCPLNVLQLDQPLALRGNVIQNWVNDTYAVGVRNQTCFGQGFPTQLPEGQRHAQFNPTPAQISTPSPAPISNPHQPVIHPNASDASLGYLTCDYPGCDYVAIRRCDISHHERCHLPAHRRPHRCALCHRRFLYPRELRRHMASHGVGIRYMCPVPRCRYATRGFGRRDHLLRHLRNSHATASRTGTDAISQG